MRFIRELSVFSLWVQLTLISTTLANPGKKHRCGVILNKARGTIDSPGYPNKYPANLSCSWTIQAPPSHKITLQFSDFRLQGGSNCRHDWLDIYDGPSIREARLGRFCGNKKPGLLTSTGQSLYLRLISNDMTEKRGFRASYDTPQDCGGTYSGFGGKISSPNYPSFYHSEANCTYKIKVYTGFRVKVRFQHFSTEPKRVGGTCYDYVEAYDGLSSDDSILGKYCGKVGPFTLLSTSNVMLLRFVSDKTVNYKGFQLVYSAEDINECDNNNGGCSHTCVNNQGSYTCRCPKGYGLKNDSRTCLAVPTTQPLVSSTLSSNSCGPHRFGCVDGTCIDKRQVCDGLYDCVDMSDELNCPCRENEMTCANGVCVGLDWICDGDDDCGDGTDEMNCTRGRSSLASANCSTNNGGCEYKCSEFYVGNQKHIRCSCKRGYVLQPDGKHCADIDECANNHGGCNHECINTAGSFHCQCFPGFEFETSQKKNCRDINECDSNNGGCSHTCINDDGSYFCQCPTGFRLQNDNRTCVDINECELNNGSCQQECQNTLGSFMCRCRDGYIEDILDPKSCMDIDECLEGVPACFDCVNTPGSYECICDDPGFTTNDEKTQCIDINECDTNNGGCGQLTCVNTYGSSQCRCPTGYSLDKITNRCIDEDECSTNNSTGDCDHICENTPGSYRCSCRDGYKIMQEKRCLDIDECAEGGHDCQHNCSNTGGSYTCSCKMGFFLSADGHSCRKLKDTEECGIAPLASTIIQGKWLPQGHPKWPWTALLHFSVFGDIEGCMATLIHKEWLITAARCLYLGPFSASESYINISPQNIKVELGAYKRWSPDHTPVLHDVSEIVVHKDFDPKTLSANIALVHLVRPVIISEDVRPICLPSRSEIEHLLKSGMSSDGIVVGWGKTPDHQVRSTLHEAAVSVKDRSLCKWSNMKYDEHNMICAGYKEQQDTTCIADSGSPLMFSVTNRNSTKWVVGGVTSWGLSVFADGCHSNYRYTGYTNVGRFLKWIRFRGNNNKN